MLGTVKVKPPYQLSGPSHWNLSWILKHEVTRSISAPSGSDASPTEGCPLHEFASTHLYTWAERDTVGVVSSPRTHIKQHRRELELRTLDSESNTLTMRPLCHMREEGCKLGKHLKTRYINTPQ